MTLGAKTSVYLDLIMELSTQFNFNYEYLIYFINYFRKYWFVDAMY
jgi:hypothetical protein